MIGELRNRLPTRSYGSLTVPSLQRRRQLISPSPPRGAFWFDEVAHSLSSGGRSRPRKTPSRDPVLGWPASPDVSPGAALDRWLSRPSCADRGSSCSVSSPTRGWGADSRGWLPRQRAPCGPTVPSSSRVGCRSRGLTAEVPVDLVAADEHAAAVLVAGEPPVAQTGRRYVGGWRVATRLLRIRREGWKRGVPLAVRPATTISATRRASRSSCSPVSSSVTVSELGTTTPASGSPSKARITENDAQWSWISARPATSAPAGIWVGAAAGCATAGGASPSQAVQWVRFVRTLGSRLASEAALSCPVHPTRGGVRKEGVPECFPSTNGTPSTA